MLEVNNPLSIVLLILIAVVIIVWLIVTIRSIRFQKRIDDYVIVSDKDEDISILGKVEQYYKKINVSTVTLLKKIKMDSLLDSFSQFEKEEELSFLASKLLSSIITFILYLFVCLFTLASFDLLTGIIVFLIGYFIPVIKSHVLTIYNKKRIENDLLKAVSLMNNSFQAGKSIIQVIEIVKNELDGPISDEFGKIENDLLHGLSLNVAFERFKNRVDIEEINYITTSLMILNQTGGNIASVFSSIEEAFYTRRKLNLELKATISSSKLVFQILVVLPLFLWGMIGLWNPSYFVVFFETELGMILFSVIICLYLLYVIIIRSVMKVEKY